MDLFEIAPIPDCTFYIDTIGRRRGLDTPVKVANEMLREVRAWHREHPGGDIQTILTNEWYVYVMENI